MGNQPIVLSQAFVTQAMADPKFLAQVPEFTPLTVKVAAMGGNKQEGCTTCQQGRITKNLYGDFVAALLSLSPSGLERFKKYANAGRIMVNAQDPNTGAVNVKVI